MSDPGRPRDPPKLDPIEEAKLRVLRERWANRPGTAEYDRARDEMRCLARMLGIVNGTIKPGSPT